MEKNQSAISKFIYLWTLVSLLIAYPLHGQEYRATLQQADSLFTEKKYTESFALYKDLFDRKRYSQSMLLKMSFIQEGLGQLATSLYYLNVYYLASGDESALKKIEQIATQDDLQGYHFDVITQLSYVLRRNYVPILVALSIVACMLFGLLWYQRRRLRQRPYGTGVVLILVMGLLFAHAQFSNRSNRGIIISDQAYFMDAPSAGASTVGVIGPGNQLNISGQQDVWLHVVWLDREGYVKKNKVRLIDF